MKQRARTSTIIAFLMLVMLGCKDAVIKEKQYVPVDMVNTLMGTDSKYSLSNGNTYPAIALPWGMNFWTPQTGKMGDGWGYMYHADKIQGIKQTHQPSPWINDYAAFSFMAETGDLKINGEERASWFSHKSETATPYYYSVYLADYDVTVEVTPTERAAIFRFTFPKSEKSYILLDAFFKGSKVNVDEKTKTVTGYCRNNSGGVPDNFHNYFVAQFSKPFSVVHTWNGDKIGTNNVEEGDHVGAALQFNTENKEQIIVKVASSFISEKQAKLNLNKEVADFSFDQVKSSGKKIWNDNLSKIMVYGKSEKDIRTFYSCLYRVLLFPRSFYEINEKNKVVHYSPYNGKVLPGYMFTDNGFWDTFRAVFPYFAFMYPEQDSKIMEGLANTYKESGWLPEWASPGHRGCMIGSNSASIIADAYLKGVPNMDMETLFDAIIKNTKGYYEDVNSVGRYGADYYNKLGYVPYNVGINENTARTLEYAYDDFCIWRLAKKLNKDESVINLFASRAQNYKNVFDPSTKLMRGKNEDGTFQSPFNPLKWGDAFTEGNSLQYTWSVFHDINGLKTLMGGADDFNAMLDTVFAMPPKFDNSYYGFTIHEIREMQIANTGNYAHGNQPIQHMIYLYNYSGQPWKAQKHVRDIMNRMYAPVPDGYCGDEDNGQTSAWYVFSSMGFYPVCPGSDQYVIGSPLFDKVKISLPNGKKLTINAKDNSKENVYVKSIQKDGTEYDKNYFVHEDLMKGGTIDFDMSAKPNKKRGVDSSSYPYSMSTSK